MHVNHVIHRDLKPGNIMIDDNFNLFLIDFGISKICANKKDTITLTKGTLRYLAPECLDILQLIENEEIISKILLKLMFGLLVVYFLIFFLVLILGIIYIRMIHKVFKLL